MTLMTLTSNIKAIHPKSIQCCQYFVSLNWLFLKMSQSSDQTANSDIRYKRKRKKSFLKNARKYGKKGCYGRGSQLDPDTYQYFIRILEAYREGFDSEEDKKIFVNNVFEQTVGQEVNCCCNQVGCRVIEMLLPFANEDVISRFIKVFGEDMRPLCSDRFASHVLEALVSICCKNSLKTDVSEEFRETFKNFTLKVSKFLLNNLEDYIWDTYGSHVIRTCLEGLAQIPREDGQNQKNNKPKKVDEIKEEVTELPEEYVEVVKDYAERVMTWPQFNELPSSEYTSGFLQVLLKSLKKIDKKMLKKVIDKLLSNFAPEADAAKNDILPSVFLSKPSIMVLESALEVAGKKQFSKMFLKCFSGRLVELATTRSTNFTVQKLVCNCKEKTEFEAIFDELVESFPEIIKAGHSGVIWAIGQACKKLATKQGSYVQNLMKSFECLEPEERQDSFVLCLARFAGYETVCQQKNVNLQKEKLNLHGTLIMQLILEYNKPIKLVNSILNTDTQSVMSLFSNPMGSHIVDSFVTSVFVGEKSRERLIRKMKGTYQELASTKYGSRSFEALFNAAGLKNKLFIMEELAHKDGSWSNSEHGKIIANKINLALFKRKKEDWQNSLNTVNKANKLFSNILGDK